MAKFNWEALLGYINEGRVVPIIGPELLRVRDPARSDGALLTLETLIVRSLATRLGIDTKSLEDESSDRLEKLQTKDLNMEESDLTKQVSEALKMGDPGQVAKELRLDALVECYNKQPDKSYDLYELTSEIMNGLDLAPSDTLLKLAAITPLKLFVSTTFDDLLKKSLDLVRGNGITEVRAYYPKGVPPNDVNIHKKLSQENDGDISCNNMSELDAPVVYHLMGKLSMSRQYVLTQEDLLMYQCALHKKETQPTRLLHVLTQNHLLLLGNHYPDWLARFFLRGVHGKVGDDGKQRYEFLADRASHHDKDFLRYINQFSTHTRIYKEGDAVQFVDKLHSLWLERHPAGRDIARSPAPSSESLSEMPEGAVFISYAHEDLPAARALKTGLQSLNIDTWFDQEDLNGGDHLTLVIRRNIENCILFMPIVSAQTEKRREGYFRKEWNWAAMRMDGFNRAKFIVPIVIDDTCLEKADVPEVFGRIKAFKILNGHPTKDILEQIRKLYRECRRIQEG